MHDIAQGTHRVVKPAAVLNTEVLGHGDLHRRDALAIPDFCQRQIGETQVFQLHDRFFAQEVIHAQDLLLPSHLMQAGIQLARRAQVVSERLFYRDPRVGD